MVEVHESHTKSFDKYRDDHLRLRLYILGLVDIAVTLLIHNKRER